MKVDARSVKEEGQGCSKWSDNVVATQIRGRMQNIPRLCDYFSKGGDIAMNCFLNKKKEKESVKVARNKENEEE